ncbi:MAG: endonuclease/exonuclease/phosphatase family protein, partial [Actinomycetota bacterium]
MRIVSWNIKFGVDIDGAVDALRRPELVDADLLLAQELDEAGAARLADALGLAVVYHPSVVHPQTGRPFGNAILTPHELRGLPPVPLPHRARISGVPRLAVAADVATPAAVVRVLSVHTEIPLLSLRRRREQFGVVADAAQAAPGPVVVGGDFNTTGPASRRALLVAMTRAGLDRLPVGSAPTQRRLGVGARLDHLFGRGVRSVAGGVSPFHP